ncbi:MAG TPA: hypothetical protein VNO51_19230 [Ilumatobacteraceae bacterium]|nr:hypothetical protein [Ilumatobacteraceae bacterium]
MTLLPANAAPASTIPRGSHVVNHHTLPGEYQLLIDEDETGCGWSLLSSFSGGPAALIDGMYFSDPGTFYVTIHASDVGFETDCAGTWTRVG